MTQLSAKEKITMQKGNWAEFFALTIIELELMKYFPNYTSSKSSRYALEFELSNGSKVKYTIKWVKKNGRDIDIYDHNSKSTYQIEVKAISTIEMV